MFSYKQGYVIGVDGGGTRTTVVLADLNGKVLNTAEAGPASPRNLGVELAAKNVAKAIKAVPIIDLILNVVSSINHPFQIIKIGSTKEVTPIMYASV